MKLYKMFDPNNKTTGFWCEDMDTVIGIWGAEEGTEEHDFGDVVELRSFDTSKVTKGRDGEEYFYKLSQLEKTFIFSEAGVYIDKIYGRWVEI